MDGLDALADERAGKRTLRTHAVTKQQRQKSAKRKPHAAQASDLSRASPATLARRMVQFVHRELLKTCLGRVRPIVGKPFLDVGSTPADRSPLRSELLRKQPRADPPIDRASMATGDLDDIARRQHLIDPGETIVDGTSWRRYFRFPRCRAWRLVDRGQESELLSGSGAALGLSDRESDGHYRAGIAWFHITAIQAAREGRLPRVVMIPMSRQEGNTGFV